MFDNWSDFLLFYVTCFNMYLCLSHILLLLFYMTLLSLIQFWGEFVDSLGGESRKHCQITNVNCFDPCCLGWESQFCM